MLIYNKYPLVKSSFFCIILLVVSGSQCTWHIISQLIQTESRSLSFCSWFHIFLRSLEQGYVFTPVILFTGRCIPACNGQGLSPSGSGGCLPLGLGGLCLPLGLGVSGSGSRGPPGQITTKFSKSSTPLHTNCITPTYNEECIL